MAKKKIVLSIILSLIGFAVWIAVGKMSHEAQAWDSIQYFQIGLPILFGASAIAGFIAPDHPWKWGLFVFILQPIALFVQSEEGPYVSVGLIFFLVFMAMAIGCAYAGKLVREYTGN